MIAFLSKRINATLGLDLLYQMEHFVAPLGLET